jgi:hypothetical protein
MAQMGKAAEAQTTNRRRTTAADAQMAQMTQMAQPGRQAADAQMTQMTQMTQMSGRRCADDEERRPQ